MASDTKRANFDLSPEQDELLTNLRGLLSVSSTKDAVLRAAQSTVYRQKPNCRYALGDSRTGGSC